MRASCLALVVVVTAMPLHAAISAPKPAPRNLVDVTSVAAGVKLEMRYAAKDNFLKEAVYPCARCLVAADVAAALARVETAVEKQGLHLKMWDCYRPQSVQFQMWKILPDARFVADPHRGSNHCRS